MDSNQKQGNREQYWRKIIESWRTSGDAISDYCKKKQLSVSGFYNWRNRLFPELKAGYKKPRQSTFKQTTLAPVQIIDRPSPSLKLNLPNGCWISLARDFDEVTLNKLMRALGGEDVHAA